jgi:hypothetical protein
MSESFNRRQAISAGWGIVGHVIDLRKLEKAEYAQEMLHVSNLVDIIKTRDPNSTPEDKEAADRLLDEMILKASDHKTVLFRRLFPDNQ